MRVNYDKSWKLARENRMNCRARSQATDVSANTVTKIGKNEIVSMDIMLRLCKVFHCDIGDLMEFIEDSGSD